MGAMAETSAQAKLQVEDARADFVARFPGYKQTALLDELRATEYRRLDERGQVYLDYTGGSLYAESQLQKHFELLRSGVLGNPHSANPTSATTTDHVERTRRFILSYFNARVEDYILVFTQNASAALKLVGESFPFAPGSRCLLTFDNHNSVNGIREFARAKGATPIVCSLIPRKIWKDDKISRDSATFGKWAADVAASEEAPFVDLNEIIARRCANSFADDIGKFSAVFVGIHGRHDPGVIRHALGCSRNQLGLRRAHVAADRGVTGALIGKQNRMAQSIDCGFTDD